MQDNDQEQRRAEYMRTLDEDELAEMVEQSRRPGILMLKTPRADDPGAPGCWLGGEPTLPPGVDWPMRDINGLTYPMHFLGQIDLTQLPEVPGTPECPKTGTLFFFADTADAQPYPSRISTNAAVIYADEDVSCYPQRAVPEMPEREAVEKAICDVTIEVWEPPEYLSNKPRLGYKRWPITFRPFDGYRTDLFPYRHYDHHTGDLNIALNESLAAKDAALCSEQPENDRREPQFAMHHIFGSQGGYEPNVDPARRGVCDDKRDTETGPYKIACASDLTRLFAVRSDQDIGLFHGDGAWVVLYIRARDLARKNFSEVIFIGESR